MYKGMQGYAEVFKGNLVFTRVYKGIQGYTGVCKGMQGYTGLYLSNRLQVSVVKKLINHAGCW